MLESKIVERSLVYEPKDALHHYRVTWYENEHYYLQRRLISVSQQPDQMHASWDKNPSVEDWVDVQEGRFEFSAFNLPKKHLLALRAVEKVIIADIIAVNLEQSHKD